MNKILFIFLPIIYILTSCSSIKIEQPANPQIKQQLEELIEQENVDGFIQLFNKHTFNLKNNIDEDGTTLLFYAASKGNTKIGVFLIQKGANVNIVSEYGTAMHWALDKKNIDFAWLLLDNDFDPKIESNIKNNKEPLNFQSFFIIKKDKEAGIKLLTKLLEKGMDPNIRDRDGAAIIHLASYYNYKEVIRLLREYKTNPNLKVLPNAENAKRDTFLANHPSPLMIASFYEKTDAVNELLKYSNIRKDIKGILNGKTALDLAKEKKNTDIIHLLTK